METTPREHKPISNRVEPTVVQDRRRFRAAGRRAFAGLRRRLLWNGLRTILERSRLRLTMILICSAVFWVGLFGLFFEGFQFLNSYFNLTNDIIISVFSIFFLSLLIMLVFSTGIILHTSLFQSRECAFLLATPASPDQIFAHKFVEAIVFSSWGFLLLGSPMMVAYGLTATRLGRFTRCSWRI